MNTIEQYIDTEMSSRITRKRNSPLPSLLVLAVGIALLILLRIGQMGDTLMATCLTLGLILTGTGLFLTGMSLSGAMTHLVYLPTRSRMRERKVYVGADDYKVIANALSDGDMQPLYNIRPVVGSNTALRIIASRDGACALMQAIRDQGGHFEPDSNVRLLTDADTAVLQHLMK